VTPPQFWRYAGRVIPTVRAEIERQMCSAASASSDRSRVVIELPDVELDPDDLPEIWSLSAAYSFRELSLRNAF